MQVPVSFAFGSVTSQPTAVLSGGAVCTFAVLAGGVCICSSVEVEEVL